MAPAYSLLTDYFRPERRGLAFAILGLATYAGQIAGQGGGPVLAELHGWRMAFWIMGAPGILFGLLLLLIVNEPPRGVVVNRANQISFRAMLAELIRAKPICSCCLHLASDRSLASPLAIGGLSCLRELMVFRRSMPRAPSRCILARPGC
ncbi:MAG: MFS transporter [Sphingomonadales bacterium]|nr:MFS transporter [Sphingomonadales bacterium]